MQHAFYYMSIFVMLLTLLIHLQFLAAPAIFVPIGFLLAIVFIAIGVIAAMKTEVDLDFMFHKDSDKRLGKAYDHATCTHISFCWFISLSNEFV